ncbi:hypothetical protein E4U30_006921 [Claviceps sp. LM220 group G6]|nr:hypothetical protein E4U30_006921 [Claviceps sp. LM220 group G6]KAG6113729.1 hypothetical protein E4U31_008035 [Claviceps sp. LM219 group G6]
MNMSNRGNRRQSRSTLYPIHEASRESSEGGSTTTRTTATDIGSPKATTRRGGDKKEENNRNGDGKTEKVVQAQTQAAGSFAGRRSGTSQGANHSWNSETYRYDVKMEDIEAEEASMVKDDSGDVVMVDAEPYPAGGVPGRPIAAMRRRSRGGTVPGSGHDQRSADERRGRDGSGNFGSPATAGYSGGRR